MVGLIIVVVVVIVFVLTALVGLWLCLIKGPSWFRSAYGSQLMRPPPLNATGDDTHGGTAGGTNPASHSSLLQNEPRNGKDLEINEVDLRRLMSYLDETDGGPPWQFMMEMSTPTLSYQAWFRDPPSAPLQLRTRTVFWSVKPELARDFFWDDEFRPNWDNMLAHFKTLEIHPQTGSMIVHWIRQLPLFCGNRDYIIIRRIWESESAYYFVSKGTTHPSIPRDGTSRRVDLYYSSLRIRAESSSGNQVRGTEVFLFHYEDINLPNWLVKMAVRAGTCGLVRRLDASIQAYSKAQADGAIPSTYAIMARMTTRIAEPTVALPQLGTEKKQKPRKRYIFKWLMIGGILLTCGFGWVTIGKKSRRKLFGQSRLNDTPG